MSLRARLLLGVLVLVGLAAVAIDVATATALHSFLLSRVDQQLVSVNTEPILHRFLEGPGTSCNTGVPTIYFAGLYGSDGSPVEECQISGEPAPVIPASTVSSVVNGANNGGAGSTSPFTVGAGGGSSLQYRAVISAVSNGQSTFALVLAEPLSDLNGTLDHLRLIEIIATLSVLGLTAIVGFWLVRVGLRPLDEVERTAGEIAEGDLSKRVARADARTEVGRLGLTFNRMLSHIEQAFSERKRTEAQLRESEQRLRRFVADASHELRTPLTSVRGYSELFRQGGLADPEELAGAMSRIEENAGRMGLLVEDLILLARLDRDRTLEREPVDLAAVASGAVADARAVEPWRPIDLVEEGRVTVLGDEARLRQVAGNLLANARMHTPPETPVEVSVRASGGRAVLQVADRGPGMDEEAARRAFERFYRADPSRSREHGGAGLGLSIVAAIIDAHGGSATVESRPGKGSAFKVELPLLDEGGDGARDLPPRNAAELPPASGADQRAPAEEGR